MQTAVTSQDRERNPLGSQQPVQQRIEQFAAELCQREFGARLRALILTGSMARGEASIVAAADGWSVLGDAEFVLVFTRDRSSDHARASILARELQDGLKHFGIECAVSL